MAILVQYNVPVQKNCLHQLNRYVLSDFLDMIHCAAFVMFPNGYLHKTSRGE